jgi:deoxycytidine triphosphate deaminase
MIISAKRIIQLNEKYRFINNLSDREKEPEGVGIDVRVGEIYSNSRSTLFRSGVLLLATKTDPGYFGELTFGLKNLGGCDFKIDLGARFANLVFKYVIGEANAYKGQWKGGRVFKAEKESYIICPRRSYLIESLEYVKMPKNIGARVEMRSTFSRHGLLTSPTSIAPGFKGNIMFHLRGSTFPIKLGKNVSVFKIILETTISDTKGYDGVYQNQNGITLPRYNDNILG